MRKTILMAIVGCICWLSASVSVAEDNQCVPHKLAIESWGEALDKAERHIDGRRMVLTVCDPCSCPVNGMAACYEYMAKEERMKSEKYNYMRDLLSRATRYGICR